MSTGNITRFQNEVVYVESIATGGGVGTGTIVTATAAEINTAADQSGNVVSVTDAASYAILAADSGKLHLLPDFAAACTMSFPAEAAGLNYEFVYVGNAADAHGFILTSGSDTNYFTGGVLHIDTDAGAGTDELVPVHPDGNSNSKITAATVDVGTHFFVRCVDGTTWKIWGAIAGTGAPVFADQ